MMSTPTCGGPVEDDVTMCGDVESAATYDRVPERPSGLKARLKDEKPLSPRVWKMVGIVT